MAHLIVEHGEESKEEVESDYVGQVERNVPAVWEQDSEPEFVLALTSKYFFSPLSFLQVDDAFVGNNALTNKPDWVKRDPQGIPGHQIKVQNSSRNISQARITAAMSALLGSCHRC